MILYDGIIKILNELKISYDEIDHEESHNCENSKKFRDNAGLSGLGSKNIVFHAKGNFYLITTYSGKQIKARNFKHEFGTKDIRFASQDEIESIIGAKIGSIPPFGFNNLHIPIYVDFEIFESEFFIFNPGDPRKSIRILSQNLRKIFNSIKNPLKYFKQSEEIFQLFEK